MDEEWGVCTDCGSVLCLCGVCHVCEDYLDEEDDDESGSDFD